MTQLDKHLYHFTYIIRLESTLDSTTQMHILLSWKEMKSTSAID